jgi:multicomponent Na+:H+ antiporter subunit D
VTELAPLAVVGPFLVAAGLAASLPLDRRRDDLVAVVTASAVTIFSALLFAEAVGSDVPLVSHLGGWEPRDGVVLGVSMAYDALGAGLALLAALLMTAALAFAWRFFDAVGPIFHALMLVFLGGMIGFCLSGDLFNLFVFFELMSVSAYALTAYRIEEAGPLQGALTFAVSNSVGAMFILFGIALLYGRTGALNMAQVGESLAGGPADALVICSFGLIATGFFVKAAIVPFHFWLSDAYAVAPTPACVVFSGIMSDLGLFAVARIYWSVYDGPLGSEAEQLRLILVSAGVLTALLGGVMCLAQVHLKRLLAFVTISQLGIALIGVGLLTSEGLAGAALFAVTDGLLRAGLFIVLGAVLHRCGSVDELRLRARGRELPRPAAALAFAGAIGLAALPPLGGFAGKGLIEHAAEETGYAWVIAAIVVATVLTAGSVLRAAGRVFLGWGHAKAPEPSRWREVGETIGGGGRTPPVMLWAGGVLTVAGLTVGLVPGIVDGVQEAAARFADRGAYAAAVLGRPAGAPAEADLFTPGLTAAALGVASVLAALALAAGMLRGRSVPFPAAARRPAAQAFFRLRRLHSGQIGDYVAWLTVGVAVLGGALALQLGG